MKSFNEWLILRENFGNYDFQYHYDDIEIRSLNDHFGISVGVKSNQYEYEHPSPSRFGGYREPDEESPGYITIYDFDIIDATRWDEKTNQEVELPEEEIPNIKQALKQDPSFDKICEDLSDRMYKNYDPRSDYEPFD